MKGFLKVFTALFWVPRLNLPAYFSPQPLLPSSSYCVSCHLKASDYLLLSAVKSRAFRLPRRHAHPGPSWCLPPLLFRERGGPMAQP